MEKENPKELQPNSKISINDDIPGGGENLEGLTDDSITPENSVEEVLIKTTQDPKKEKKKKKHWHIAMVVMSCFFVTVATILGTGILALPVKLSISGFGPFLATFVFCLIAQSLTIVYVIELLQKTEKLTELKDKEKNAVKEIELEENGNVDTTTIASTKETTTLLSDGPDLHTMGLYFLDKFSRIVFDSAVLLHFISVLISYGLAGPIAYKQLIFLITNYKINLNILIVVFILVLWTLIIFGNHIISQVISLFTLIKGTMLVVMISLIGVIGFKIGHSSIDDWQYTGRPFLIGIVALGGAINTLPLVWSKMEKTKLNVRLFRFASVGGLFVCWVLNICWCYFILKIVPQTTNDPNEPSLEKALANGELSTIPLVDVFKKHYPNLAWIGYAVDIFIILSITVSFLALGSGLKHMLDGYVKSTFRKSSFEKKINSWKYMKGKGELIFQFSLYFFSFCLIMLVAQLNPKGFIDILEIFTSLALNLESGVFVAIMLWKSKKYKNLKIADPLPVWVINSTIWFTIGYFLFACVYDIVVSILKLFLGQVPF